LVVHGFLHTHFVALFEPHSVHSTPSIQYVQLFFAFLKTVRTFT
jgi:hypothetical protein